jgi:MFS family permease
MDKDIYIIYMSLLFFAVAMGLYSVIMPAYIRELGASSVQLGLLGSIAMAMGTAAAIPGGLWADRYERRTLLIIGWAMCIPVPLFFAFAKTWWALIPGYFLFNFSMFCNSSLQAYVAARTTPENRGFVFTFVFSSFSMGMIFAPTVGGFMAENWGIRSVFWLSLIFYSLSTLALFLIAPSYPEKRETARRLHIGDFSRQYWSYVLLFSCGWFAMNIPLSFNTPFLQDVARLDLLTIGMLGSISAVGGAVLSPFLGRAADRGGALRILGIGFCVVGLAYLIQITLPVRAFLMMAFLVRGGAAAVMSLMTSVVSRTANKASLGMSFAIYNLMTGLSSTVAPYTAGWLYESNARAPFMVSIAVAVSLGSYFILRRGRERDAQCSPTT